MVSIKKSTYLYEYIIHVFPEKSIIYADFEVVFLFQSVKKQKNNHRVTRNAVIEV